MLRRVAETPVIAHAWAKKYLYIDVACLLFVTLPVLVFSLVQSFYHTPIWGPTKISYVALSLLGFSAGLVYCVTDAAFGLWKAVPANKLPPYHYLPTFFHAFLVFLELVVVAMQTFAYADRYSGYLLDLVSGRVEPASGNPNLNNLQTEYRAMFQSYAGNFALVLAFGIAAYANSSRVVAMHREGGDGRGTFAPIGSVPGEGGGTGAGPAPSPSTASSSIPAAANRFPFSSVLDGAGAGNGPGGRGGGRR